MDAEKQLSELAVRLLETTVRNTASVVSNRIQTVKAKKNDKETIQELEEIISTLISDKNELVQIAQSYEHEFIAQQISKEDIEYITTSFIPVLKDLIKQTTGDTAEGLKTQKTIDDLTPLLSVETLTVLQLLGFNFKKAIGEPLTILLQKAITSKIAADPQASAEYTKLALKYNTENLKVVQDKDASERFKDFKAKGLM